ncbi:MAG: protein translocase subunit SecF [Alphaproteobacteria bacterium]|nr:protein translocase subunit SecF [Alphaproteobacteria bacterium]
MKFNIQFIKYRHIAYVCLAALIAASIGSFFVRGLNYGIDFSGGISLEVATVDRDFTIDRMRTELAQFSPELQEMRDTGNVVIRVGLAADSTEAEQQGLLSDLRTTLGDRVTFEQVQIVGPQIGGELIRGGIMAVFFAFILMSLYIWIRYRGGYATSSFITLCLDFVVMFGFFSLVGLEFNQTAIAVILMAIGYSTNDKVVNFDRIDENFKKYHKMPKAEVINLSVNEMLLRTIITSSTTIACMFGLYLFGGAMLREFAIAMIFGVVLGSLTSIFISNALLLNFSLREEK